jgi:tripartite-type tricarboxylate transporter receptor subunit TctC
MALRSLNLLLLVVGAAAGVAFAQQPWPAAPVKVLVANSPGTATDIAARLFADGLARSVGQSVVIDNRPGADGYIAAEAVARSAPDGYTLFFASQSVFGIGPFTRKVQTVDPERDFTPIAIMVDDTGAIGLYVHPGLPVTTLPELIAYAKANPGKLSFASIVPLFSMLGAWLNNRAGIDMVDIKYKSAPQGLQDVLTGRVPIYLNAFGTMEQHVKSGKLRVLAVTRPVDDYPQVPTFESYFPEFRQPGTIALVGPAGMPSGLVERINRASAAIVENPKFNKDLAPLRWRNESGARTPQAAAQVLRQGRAEWGAFIRQAGIQPE